MDETAWIIKRIAAGLVKIRDLLDMNEKNGWGPDGQKIAENSRTRMNLKFEVDSSRPDTDVHIPNFSYLGMMILEFELRQPGIETTAIVDLNGGNR